MVRLLKILVLLIAAGGLVFVGAKYWGVPRWESGQKYTAKSQVKGYDLTLTDSEPLEKAIEANGFTFSRQVSVGEKYKPVKGFDFILTSVQQPNVMIKGPSGQIVQSAGIKFDSRTGKLVISIHVDKEVLDDVAVKGSRAADTMFASYICQVSDQNTGVEFASGCLSKSKSLFWNGGKQVFKIFPSKKILNWSLVGKVYAGCEGEYNCCGAVQVCSCSHGGGSCVEGSTGCGGVPFSTCNCVTEDQIVETPSCASAGFGSCYAGACTGSTWNCGSSCNWVSPPVPTNTPAPTSPPPLGCGTCGGCTPACGSSCEGTCSDNGSACTIYGPPCGEGPTLDVTLTTVPASPVKVDHAVDLVANVDGTATGDIRYKFDCTNDGIYEHNSGLVTTDPYTWVGGCTYKDVGTYTIEVLVKRDKLEVTDTVTMVVKSLTVTLSASPATGTAPLNDVDLTASVGGTATGEIRYRFDCTNDGAYDHDVTVSTPPRTPYTWVNGCNYPDAGTYTAKVRVNRGEVAATTTTGVTADAPTPTPTPTPEPTPAVSAWWQVRGGGGAIAAGGGMQSLVPATQYACLVQAPAPACGVAAGNPTINGFGSSQWASTGSNYFVTGSAVDVGALAGKYKYDGLKARIRAGVNPATVTAPTTITLSDGYVDGLVQSSGAGWVWVTGAGTTSISGSVTTRKVVILVDGTVNVAGNITVANRSTGNVVIISGGNMTLAGTVGNIDGIYMTDGVFDTGVGGELTVNGTVVAWGGLALARNSSDNGTIPAEVFNFVPDLVVNLPQPVLRRHIVQELENP